MNTVLHTNAELKVRMSSCGSVVLLIFFKAQCPDSVHLSSSHLELVSSFSPFCSWDSSSSAYSLLRGKQSPAHYSPGREGGQRQTASKTKPTISPTMQLRTLWPITSTVGPCAGKEEEGIPEGRVTQHQAIPQQPLYV